MKTSHVRTSSACIDDRPWISVSRNILHTRVHAAPSPVSRLQSFMCLRSPSRAGCFWSSPPSCFPRSSHLQKPSRPSHSTHPPRMFFPERFSTMSQST